MQIVVFEDQSVDMLAPITLTRPAMAVSCGGYRLIDLLAPFAERYDATIHAFVRPHLRALVSADYPALKTSDSVAGGPVLLINARMVPAACAVNRLESWFREGADGVVRCGESVAAARWSENPFEGQALDADLLQSRSSVAGLPEHELELPLFEFPHDVVRIHGEILSENLEYRVTCGNYRQTVDGVFCACEHLAAIAESAVFDTSLGPVIIESEADVGPHTSIVGPCCIGRRAKVAAGARLKGAVALGHTTKAGGEIEAAILEPFTNKQHAGVLGSSYLGSWINIGAGTNQSDLKNTYGSIRVDYGGKQIDTGMQFFGAIIGDYTKTAINTGIFTGKVVGVASTLYGMVTENVASFVNYARSLGQQSEIPASVAITTQERMFARRSVDRRPCDQQLLHDVYEITAPERARLGLSSGPLTF